MARTVKVKICGLTRAADALAALDAGADYLGFILYPPSPRAIAPHDAADLVAELRAARRGFFARPEPPLLVGVFVNEPPAGIAKVLERCGLDLAQLSGDEAADSVTDPASPLFGRAYKAIRPRTLADAAAQATQYTDGLSGMPLQPCLLVDTPHQALYGGTGETGDWAIAATLASTIPGLMLAGGLTPDNVAAAVATVRPFAVDVAGGVESAPGQKDHRLVADFIHNAKGA
jgi:phosphoribosylanthranilate isomerase